MSDDVSLPQIIVSEVVPSDTALIVPNSNQQYLDYFNWQRKTRYNNSHAMNMVIDTAYKVVTTNNHNGTYTHTWIPRPTVGFKFGGTKYVEDILDLLPNHNRIPRLPIMLNEKFLGSTFGNWLQEEGINHEVNQEALRRVLAWQSTKQPILDQNYNNSSLNQVLTGYQAKPLTNLYEISYGVLLGLFDKVRGKL